MITIDDVLNMDIRAPQPGHLAALKVGKDNYQRLVSHQNLSSYSMQQAFHECPRKYQLKKMQASIGAQDRISSPTFAFGHAVGAGVAVYDATEDMEQAIWAAFLAWDIDLFSEETKGTRKTGKSFHEAVWALYGWRQFRLEETDLCDYETVNIEATIAVDFEDGHYYVGHIDELLRHKVYGTYRVKENKTTGLTNVDAAMYSNSDQALSYAIVVDMLDGTEFEVLYTVYSSATQSWQQFSFVKGASKKAEWIQDQLLRNQQQDAYAEINFFPKRGSSCMNYMRRCEFYETCDLSPERVFGKRFDELPEIEGKEHLEQFEPIDYFTTLTDIVNRQKARNQR